ncbi:hypothetical protein CTH_0622 [Carboxydocella thermautotrophica]|nr:hypothetical protein CTH_0622 [Carboxydocella thermautotrophica]
MTARALLVDFGSTYTKVTAVDLEKRCLLGTARAFTTVQEDINIGLTRACRQLGEELGEDPLTYPHKLGCSSAAGGLKLAAIGLVRELTVEAARLAALGAGARLTHVFSRFLTPQDVEQMAATPPDIILLAGGTDGGNRETIIANAHTLAVGSLRVPVVVAGNKVAAAQVAEILSQAGFPVRVTENVMPELNQLNVEPARETIREVFLERIIAAKGLDKAETLLGIVMPTPAAVLQGARLLAEGTPGQRGWGELLLVDIGGATTDVHSIAEGGPSKPGVNWKGLPEPKAKRTVEGDLGMRYSAEALWEATPRALLLKLFREKWQEGQEYVRKVHQQPDYLPVNEQEWEWDTLLGYLCARLATERHVGQLETVYTPFGATFVQYGKDLTQIGHVIGTGGVLVHHPRPRRILEGVLFEPEQPMLLKPMQPRLWLDQEYILAAMGLLAEIDEEAAMTIMTAGLREI